MKYALCGRETCFKIWRVIEVRGCWSLLLSWPFCQVFFCSFLPFVIHLNVFLSTFQSINFFVHYFSVWVHECAMWKEGCHGNISLLLNWKIITGPKIPGNLSVHELRMPGAALTLLLEKGEIFYHFFPPCSYTSPPPNLVSLAIWLWMPLVPLANSTKCDFNWEYAFLHSTVFNFFLF